MSRLPPSPPPIPKRISSYVIVSNNVPILSAPTWDAVDEYLKDQKALLGHSVSWIDRQLFVGVNTVTTAASTFTDVVFIRNRQGWGSMLSPTQTLSSFQVYHVPDLTLSAYK